MSKQFNANISILGAEEVSSGIWRTYATVSDYSTDGWSVSDVQVGDCFIDESPLFVTQNRWSITEIVATGAPAYPGGQYNSIQFICRWDDIGEPDIFGPQGNGIVSRTSGAMRSMWGGSVSIQLISEPVAHKVQAINNFACIDKFMQKSVKNGTLETLLKNRVAAWQDNGTVCYANASVHSVSDIAGLLLEDIAPSVFGQMQKTGYIPDALTGLSAIPGAAVFLSDVDGTMSLTPPTGATDSIIKMGRAEPPSGVATATANDLHMEIEYISEP
jgi:hypothetical protein